MHSPLSLDSTARDAFHIVLLQPDEKRGDGNGHENRSRTEAREIFRNIFSLQHLAQSVNLFAFLPMAVFSLRVHAKNGLLDARGTPWMIVPAAALSALGAWLVQGVAAEALRVGFGVFLCVLSLYQFAGGAKALQQKRR